MIIRVAGAQLAVAANIEENTESICRGIDYARGVGADILLTPEGSLSGYTHQFSQREVEQGLQRVLAAAGVAQVGLALGTCFIEEDGRCYNQLRFYRPGGEYLGFHSKTLTCGSWDDPPRGEINHFAVAALRTYQWDTGLSLGGLICNDLWANPACTPMPDPHLTQQLASRGAKIVFHAVNGGRNGGEWSKLAWNFHDSNLRMRARAGKLWIVTVDSSNPVDLPCSAPSGVVSPDGEWLCRADPMGERFYSYTIEL